MFFRSFGLRCGVQKHMKTPLKKKHKSVDQILGDVMIEAMRERDKGGRPDMEFLYKKSQEKMYEEEFGTKPPSIGGNYRAHIPYLPDTNPRRLVPLDLFDDDPWPRRSYHSPLEDEHGKPLKELTEEEKAELEADDISRAPADACADALDELFYWELKYLEFLREFPVTLRRSLPLYVDRYKHLTHRLYRAERRFLRCRDKAMLSMKATPETYKLTEDRIERIRKIYAETHKALCQYSYDPIRMRKTYTGPILKMTDDEFKDFKEKERHRTNELMARFSEGGRS